MRTWKRLYVGQPVSEASNLSGFLLCNNFSPHRAPPPSPPPHPRTSLRRKGLPVTTDRMMLVQAFTVSEETYTSNLGHGAAEVPPRAQLLLFSTCEFSFRYVVFICPSVSFHTHTHARTHTRTHARTHARTFSLTHTHTHTHTHARTHARARARAHTHTHIQRERERWGWDNGSTSRVTCTKLL